MAAALLKHDVTPEQLMNRSDAVAFELVDGRLRKRNRGAESSEIAGRILILLGFFLRGNRLGRLFGSDTSYQCFSEAPKKIRRADVGFIRIDCLPNGRAPKGQILIAPDLVVEVVSPNDTSEEVDEKVFEWLAAGAMLVWVVSPSLQTVRIHRPRGSAAGQVSILAAYEQITGEDALPGFACGVKEFFD